MRRSRSSDLQCSPPDAKEVPSGAVNHVTGVDAELFIAVNKDANAPIFNYCDYGVVGDMDEVCDHMIELLKK